MIGLIFMFIGVAFAWWLLGVVLSGSGLPKDYDPYKTPNDDDETYYGY